MVLGVLFAVFGAPTAWRARGLRLVLEPEAVTIRGNMWSRPIERSAVQEVSTDNSFPTIRWKTRDGKSRATPVWVISKNGLGRYGEHARLGEKMLREWADSRSHAPSGAE